MPSAYVAAGPCRASCPAGVVDPVRAIRAGVQRHERVKVYSAIHLAIAVVVEAVAEFGCAGVDGPSCGGSVVAVVGARAARCEFGKQVAVGGPRALRHG